MEKIKENKSYRNSVETDSFVRLDQLSWQQIDGLDRSKTLFFLPISPLEEHGPHLPVGTDIITAEDTAIHAMKKIKKKHPSYTCVLLPSLPLGYAGFNTDFPGTISVSSRIVKKVIVQYAKMLAIQDFNRLMICTYHMALGHLKGIYAAIKKLRKSYDMNICEPWGPIFYSDMIESNQPKVDFDTKTEVHAGFRETSLMKYVHPELVKDSYKTLPVMFSKEVLSLKVLFHSFKKLGLSEGYIGSPSKADLTYGKWFFEFTVKAYVDAAEQMIENNPLPDLPKQIKRQMKLLFWL